MEKIENGEVSTLIVKDMSRLGRDYLKVGFYTEVLFVEKGVRFIAINNGIDSANQQDSDFTPFLNIINEWYAKDTSKKIRAVMKSKGEAGEHLSQNIGGYDIILVARARTPYLKSTQLSKTLAGLMRKAGLPDKAAAVPQQPAAKPQPNGAPE